MKIGILTHQYIANYGAFLQTYALQETIKSMFPSAKVEVINYVNKKHYIINIFGWYRFNLKKENLVSYLKKIKTPRIFSKAEKKYLNLSKKIRNIEDINKLNYDTIIIGSDEVWNYEDKKSFKSIKFGVGLNCNNLVAYAPSVGKSNNIDLLDGNIINSINKFKFLSGRDQLTLDFIKKTTNKDAQIVLDPTFLYDFHKEIYEKNNRYYNKKYILFYYCDNLPKNILNSIKEFAELNDYMILGAGEHSKFYDDYNLAITPFDWIKLFENAKIIFTGTFHGVVFSIKYRRNFYAYLTNESRLKKVSSLLGLLKIDDRIINNKKYIDFNSSIDYDRLNTIIEDNINSSIAFLNNSISHENKN